MSSPLYLLLYSDGIYSTVLQYITLPHHMYRVLQGANAPFATKVVVFVQYSFFLIIIFFALSEFMLLQCTILSRPICFFGCLKMCLLNIQ